MEVSLVPPNMLEALWPKLFPHLQKAADYTYGRYGPEDIFDMAATRNAHMWVALEDDNVVGITVTRFWQYPRKLALDVMFLGGTNWDEWKDDMFDIIQRWARDSKCDVIESSGRPGFAKVFKSRGYTPLWQVFEFPVVGGQDG